MLYKYNMHALAYVHSCIMITSENYTMTLFIVHLVGLCYEIVNFVMNDSYS